MTSGGPARLAFRPPPAGGRGSLAISERTRNRIAAEAAAEAIRATVSEPVEGRPGAVVRVRRGRADVRLNIALPYPADIGALCGDVRRSVSARCAELTGTPVRRVDVTVDRLERAELEPRRPAVDPVVESAVGPVVAPVVEFNSSSSEVSSGEGVVTLDKCDKGAAPQ